MTSRFGKFGSNKTISEMIRVCLSNLSIVFSGIFVGFLVPKILGVTDYGYYKTFTLYSTYIGIFSFGISEGVYLKYSGVSYNDLEKPRIRLYTKLVYRIQLIASIAVSIISLVFLQNEYRVIFLAIALYLFELNITTYYQYIAQMTFRFNDYSMRNIVKSVLTIISTLGLAGIYTLLGKETLPYTSYLSTVLIISSVLFVMYIVKFKDITFGKSLRLADETGELRSIIKIGVPFLIASLCSTLIFTIDRQFVSILFDTDMYSIYAFAYNMISLITVCTSAISTVLYPTLKSSSSNSTGIAGHFDVLTSYVLWFVFAAIAVYFPLSWFVNWFLPQYSASLTIFRIILPGVAITAVIHVVIQNYYKLINRNWLFFGINLTILAVSVVANLIAYTLFHSTAAISVASVIVIFIYYIVSETYFVKTYNVKWQKNLLFSVLCTIVFYLITSIDNLVVGGIVYIVILLFTMLLLYGKLIKNTIHRK